MMFIWLWKIFLSQSQEPFKIGAWAKWEQSCSVGQVGLVIFSHENGPAPAVGCWEKSSCYVEVMVSGRMLKSSQISGSRETMHQELTELLDRFSFSFSFLRTKSVGGQSMGGTECVPWVLLNSWTSLFKTRNPLIFNEHTKHPDKFLL